MGYQRGMSVLTVGDGDLTFSLAVARIMLTSAEKQQQDRQHRNSSRLVATSYESRDTLLKVYPNIGETIRELESMGATVCYEVDATNIARTLPENVRRVYNGFNRITWNFPCSAIGSGQDGQNDAMEFNKQLIRDFVRNSITSELLDENDGEIHMLHKTKPPFNQWQIESVALEGLNGKSNGDKTEMGLEYKGRIAFDRCLMPPYVPRKALDKKSFTCHDACTYVFGWKGAGDKKFGCTIRLEDGKNEGAGQEDGRGSEPLLVVTKDMIAKIRQIHLDAKAAKMAAAAKATGRSKKGGVGFGAGNNKKKRRRR